MGTPGDDRGRRREHDVCDDAAGSSAFPEPPPLHDFELPRRPAAPNPLFPDTEPREAEAPESDAATPAPNPLFPDLEPVLPTAAEDPQPEGPEDDLPESGGWDLGEPGFGPPHSEPDSAAIEDPPAAASNPLFPEADREADEDSFAGGLDAVGADAAAQVPAPDGPAAPLDAGDDAEDDPEALASFMAFIEDVYHTGEPEAPTSPPPLKAAPPTAADVELDLDADLDDDVASDTLDQPVASEPGVAPKAALPHWWRTVCIEVTALFGLATIAELYWRNGQVGFVGFEPHPYWLIVLPMAAARGAVAALVAAVVASILHVTGLWQAHAGAGLTELLRFEFMKEPIMFTAVGFLIGDFRDDQAQRHTKLWRRYERLQEQLHGLFHENDLLTQANLELKRRFVDHTTMFGNMIDTAAMVESASRDSIYELALQMVADQCGASRASVLTPLGSGGVDLAAQIGWSEDTTRETLEAVAGASQVQRALQQARPINGLDPTESLSADGPLAVAPISGNDGTVCAVLCLDDIPVRRLNDATVSIFFGIAEWITATLRRAERTQTAFGGPAPALAPSAPQLRSPRQLAVRLLLEDSRCSRLGIGASLITLQTIQRTPRTAAENERVERYVADTFAQGLRASDTLYRFGYPGAFVLVLGGTPAHGAEVVRRRLQRRLEFLRTDAVGDVELTVFVPDETAPDLATLLPRLTDHFCENAPIALDPRCPFELPSALTADVAGALVDRLRIEISLAQRFGTDLHAIELRAPSDTEESCGVLARHCEHVANQLLRTTDGIYTLPPDRCAIVLPGARSEHAGIVMRRLLDALRSRIPESSLAEVSGQLRALIPGLGQELIDGLLAGGKDDAEGHSPARAESAPGDLADGTPFANFDDRGVEEQGGEG